MTRPYNTHKKENLQNVNFDVPADYRVFLEENEKK